MSTHNYGNAIAPHNQAPKPKTISELAAMHTIFRPEDLNDQDCPICNEKFVRGPNAEFALKLPDCGHIFGLSCIKVWLESNNSCPMCRKAVLDVPPPFEAPQQLGVNFVTITLRMNQIHSSVHAPFNSIFELTDQYMAAELQILNIAAQSDLTFGELPHILWAQFFQVTAENQFVPEHIRPRVDPRFNASLATVVSITRITNTNYDLADVEEEDVLDEDLLDEDLLEENTENMENLTLNEEAPANKAEALENPPDNVDAAIEAVMILHDMMKFWFIAGQGIVHSFALNPTIAQANRMAETFINAFTEREVFFHAAMTNARPLSRGERWTRASALSTLTDILYAHVDIEANGLLSAVLDHPFGDNRSWNQFGNQSA